MRLLAVWFINALALLALPWLVPAIHIEGFATALVVVLVLGFVNTIIRPILVILTLPATVLTLGLFIFVINAALFLLVAHLFAGFSVGGFWPALFGSLLYSLISWLLSGLLLGRRG